jgi:hypothetical protein
MKTVARAFLVAVLAAGPAMAQSLSIKPGMWESTMTRTNPLTGSPETVTESECITPDKATFDPREMMKGSSDCRIGEQDKTGNTLTFTMVCAMDEGEATARGTMTADGDNGSGRMEMEMSFGGQTMKMDMDWKSRRVGDC